MSLCKSELMLDLEYRGEGSAAIVFSLPQSNQVLRLFKSDTIRKIRKEMGVDKGTETNCLSVQFAVKEQLENVVNYMKNVMQPLFSGHYVLVPTLTEVPPGFANKALAMTGQQRPEHRKSCAKNPVETDLQWALVLPDCCFVRSSDSVTSRLSTSGKNDNGTHCRDFSILSEGSVTNNQHMVSENTSQDHHVPRDQVGHYNIPQRLPQDQQEASPNYHHDLSSPNASGSSILSYPQQSSSHGMSTLNGSHGGEKEHNDVHRSINSEVGSSSAISHAAIEAEPKATCEISAFSNYAVNHRSTVESYSSKVNQRSPKYLNNSGNFTMSIEIKPKKAFMSAGSMGGSGVCKFCMHQCLKHKDGKFSEISGYCPIDLFSGNRARMRHSLLGLIKAPQHQLKLCKDGKEVYGSEIRQDLNGILKDWFPQSYSQSDDLVRDFLDLVVEILLHSPPKSAGSDGTAGHKKNRGTPTQRVDSTTGTGGGVESDPVSRVDAEVTRVTSQAEAEGRTVGQRCLQSPCASADSDKEQVLPEGCVLGCISRLQQLDTLDVEGVYPLHSALLAKMEESPELRSKCCWEGPYLSPAWILGERYSQCGDGGSLRDQVGDNVLKVKRFLVSKTLQDCSIIVAVKPVQEALQEGEEDGQIKFQDFLYDFSISVIDLDPKSFDKIPFYYAQALEITTAFEGPAL